jgi:hypothetical protein
MDVAGLEAASCRWLSAQNTESVALDKNSSKLHETLDAGEVQALPGLACCGGKELQGEFESFEMLNGTGCVEASHCEALYAGRLSSKWQPLCLHGCCWQLCVQDRQCHPEMQMSAKAPQEWAEIKSILKAEGKQLWLNAPVVGSKQARGALEASLALLVEVIFVSLHAGKTVIIADERGAYLE